MARFVSASIFFEAATMASQLAATCGATCDRRIARSEQFKQWIEKTATAQNAVSAQYVFESCSLLTVAVAFIATWPLCLYINSKAHTFLHHTLRRVDATASTEQHRRKHRPVPVSDPSSSQESKFRKIRDLVGGALRSVSAQRRRLLAWTLVVVVTFVPRCVVSVLTAYASINSEKSSACNQCESCQPDVVLINTWLGLLPELHILITAGSEPIALAFSLYCMLSGKDRDLLRTGRLRAEDNEAAALGLIGRGMHIDLPVTHAVSAEAAAAAAPQGAHEWRPSAEVAPRRSAQDSGRHSAQDSGRHSARDSGRNSLEVAAEVQ